MYYDPGQLGERHLTAEMETRNMEQQQWLTHRIRVMRAERGLSQERLAIRMGWQPSRLIQKENARSRWHFEDLPDLARALEVQVGDILDGLPGMTVSGTVEIPPVREKRRGRRRDTGYRTRRDDPNRSPVLVRTA